MKWCRHSRKARCSVGPPLAQPEIGLAGLLAAIVYRETMLVVEAMLRVEVRPSEGATLDCDTEAERAREEVTMRVQKSLMEGLDWMMDQDLDRAALAEGVNRGDRTKMKILESFPSLRDQGLPGRAITVEQAVGGWETAAVAAAAAGFVELTSAYEQELAVLENAWAPRPPPHG